MILRSCITLLLVIISVTASGQSFIDLMPDSPEIITGFNLSTAKNILDRSPLHHIEGIWRFTDTGVTVAIMHHTASDTPTADGISGYRLIVVHSPNRTLRPGTVIGYISPTAKSGEYEAKIFSQQQGIKLINTKKFSLSLNDADSSIIFRQHRSAITINIWRALPYMFRGLIRKNEPEKSTHGCVKIYPEPDKPLQPIYL